MNNTFFTTANVLLPKAVDWQKWAVIACDQFTSEPEYWQQVEQQVGGARSTLGLMLPEVYLDEGSGLASPFGERCPKGGEGETVGDHPSQSAELTALPKGRAKRSRIEEINCRMQEYLDSGVFAEYKDAYIYVERTLLNGQIRRGVVGCVDLAAYDYTREAKSPVRATERTVLERIPPRKKIREHAPLELTHVLLLCNDEKQRLVESLTAKKGQLPLLYDFDLMQGGGHIRGWLVQGPAAADFAAALQEYIRDVDAKYAGLNPMYFAVGDGNHSLCTAKVCYETEKAAAGREDLPSRYALVELENIQDPAQQFEPIHRIVTDTDVENLLAELQQVPGIRCHPVAQPAKPRSETGSPLVFRVESEDPSLLAVGILQDFLDGYLARHPGKIDYIHDDAALVKLADRPGAVGFLLPPVDKNAFFKSIIVGGVLPRKTFSMGHAQEKRYYLESRKIK